MEFSWESIKAFAPAVGLIAVFVAGLMSILRRIKPIDANPHFKAWLPLLPAILGISLGIALPLFFPANTDLGSRGFFGGLGGMNASMFFAFIRRYIRMKAGKVLGDDAGTLFAAVDENGITLPPDGSMQRPNIVKPSTAPSPAKK